MSPFGRKCADEQEMRRLRIIFRGEVQGVGFRWTSRRVALEAGCTGWVRNESDGSVTLELQGTDEQIANYFGAFGRAYAGYPIDYVMAQKDEMEPNPDDTSFSVKF